MDPSLALTALLMGLAGGPHCVAMCGAACVALGAPRTGQGAGAAGPAGALVAAGRSPAAADAPVAVVALGLPALAGGAPGRAGRGGDGRRGWGWDRARAALAGGAAGGVAGQGTALWRFLLGRLAGYSAMGALAAGSMQALGWMSIQSAALRPLWSLLHVAAALVGLWLVLTARQPGWLEDGARRVWAGLQALLGRLGLAAGGRSAPLALGLAWALLPCGLLYSALLVAALGPGVWQGALVMALFALGSGLSLAAGPWLWRRLGGRLGGQAPGGWAMRLAGAALLASAVWALWQALAQDAAPWCVTPV